MSETPSMLTRMANAISDLPPVATRIVAAFGVLVVGGLAGWIGRGALAGPPDVPTMQVYQDWRLLCPATKDKDVSCEMSQSVVNQQAHMQVARLVLLKEKDKNTVLAVTVPLDVLLEPGMGLKLGSEQVRIFQYRTCTEEGCVTVIPVDDKIEGAFAKAQDAGIAVAQLDGKAVELPFSMKGYVEARNAFLSNEAKRNSWWRRLWS